MRVVYRRTKVENRLTKNAEEGENRLDPTVDTVVVALV